MGDTKRERGWGEERDCINHRANSSSSDVAIPLSASPGGFFSFTTLRLLSLPATERLSQSLLGRRATREKSSWPGNRAGGAAAAAGVLTGRHRRRSTRKGSVPGSQARQVRVGRGDPGGLSGNREIAKQGGQVRSWQVGASGQEGGGWEDLVGRMQFRLKQARNWRSVARDGMQGNSPMAGKSEKMQGRIKLALALASSPPKAAF